MAGYNYAQNIIGLKKGAGDIHELEVEVANLSASVLSIAEDVQEISLEVSQLSASTLPYSGAQTVKQKIENIELKKKTFSVTPVPNSYAAPFTHAATINYDNDIVDAEHFVCGNAVVEAAVVVRAALPHILVYCSNSSTFNVDIYYTS